MSELDPNEVVRFAKRVTEYLFRIKKSFRIIMRKISGLDQRTGSLEDRVRKLEERSIKG